MVTSWGVCEYQIYESHNERGFQIHVLCKIMYKLFNSQSNKVSYNVPVSIYSKLFNNLVNLTLPASTVYNIFNKKRRTVILFYLGNSKVHILRWCLHTYKEKLDRKSHTNRLHQWYLSTKLWEKYQCKRMLFLKRWFSSR